MGQKFGTILCFLFRNLEGQMRRSVAVQVEQGKIMAEMQSGKRFDLCGGFEAIVAIPLLFAWWGFWQTIFFRLLQIFEALCYSLVARRNRTLKTKYGKGSKILPFKY